MRKLTALASGLLFSFGLIISDMVNPARVIAFLDVTGEWDPTLAFVMVGAIGAASIAWLIARPRKRRSLVVRFHLCLPNPLIGNWSQVRLFLESGGDWLEFAPAPQS